MKNDNTQQCPKGINYLLVCVTVPSRAKGRMSRTRRLITTLVPGDRVVVFGEDGSVLFELYANCKGKVSTVVPLDK